MVALNIFRSRNFTGANLLTLLLYGGLGGALYFLPFNLQQVQGYSPTAAGATFVPFPVVVFALSRWAGGLRFAPGGWGGVLDAPVFLPAPRVESTVFRLERPAPVPDAERLEARLRELFAGRRKKSAAAGGRRVEEVPPAELLALARK